MCGYAVFVNELGAVTNSTTLPTVCLLLATVVTAGGVVTSVSDQRPRFVVRPQTQFIKVLGGTGGQGDYTLSGTATLSDGLYYFRNFTIQAAAGERSCQSQLFAQFSTQAQQFLVPEALAARRFDQCLIRRDWRWRTDYNDR